MRVPLSSRLAPAAGILTFLLAVPVSGFGQRGAFTANAPVQGRGSATATATPPAASKVQNPAPKTQGQSSPRPTPSAERFLNGWWNDDAIKKELKLTDSQVRQITQIFDRRVRDLTPTYEEYRKQRAELDRLTEERTVDESTYALQVGRTQYLLSKLNETRTVMLYTILRRLDAKQVQQLQAIGDRMRSGRGGGAPSR